MTRLYLRIFLGFWLVMVLTLAITVGVSRSSARLEVERERVATLRSSLDALAAQAQRALDGDGIRGLRDWLETEVRERPEPALLILGPEERELLGRPLPAGPPRLQERLARLAEAGTGPPRRLPVRVLLGPDGERYLLFVPLRERPTGRWLIAPEARRNFLLVALLLSGVVCFLLARYLTAPVRALREAGQRLAAGDLGARVGSRVGARRDELGTLAREFDRMAARLQELVGSQQRLLRDVSHELRSPLTRLQTAVGLIRQRQGGTPDADLDRIEREAERLDDLIGRILAWSRVQAQTAVSREPLDLAGLVGEIVADARFEGRAVGRQVDFKSPSPVLVRGDENLLRSAIENVVRNGLAHARTGLQVWLGRAAGDRVLLTISDDGPGVPDHDLPRLFEPFWQGGGERAGSAGLGLAIAARAVVLHGGTLAARNRPCGGLEVEFRLPA